MRNDRRPTGVPEAKPQGAAVHHLHQIELATRWRISHKTLERWRWLRRGPCYIKVGGRVVYRLEDIEAFEHRHARGDAS